MESVKIYVSNWCEIDISKFSNLQFRKDGGFDGRRSEEYYREIKEYIAAYENEVIEQCKRVWANSVTPMAFSE